MHVHDLESVLPARGGQHGKISATPATEAEVVPDNEITHLQAFHQQALYEFFGFHRGKPGVKFEA